MSSRDGPSPLFEGDDFSYWKIYMEAYLQAVVPGVLRATLMGLPLIADKTKPTPDEAN